MKNSIEYSSSIESIEKPVLTDSQVLQLEIVEDLVRNGNVQEIVENVETDPKTQAVVDKILLACMKDIDSSLDKITSLNEYMDVLYDMHPQLVGTLAFEFGTQGFSCDSPEECSADERLLLLVLHDCLAKEENLSVNDFRKRFAHSSAEILRKISKEFTKQQSYITDPQQTFKKIYSLDDTEVGLLVEHLQKVKKKSSENESMQAGNGLTLLAGIVIGAVVASVCYEKYISITYGDGKFETMSELVSLGDPEFLSQLISAKQPFLERGKSYNKQYEVNPGDDYYYLKLLANAMQNKELYMEVSGELGAVFEMEGSSFMYNRKTQMIEIIVSEPKIVALDSDATVLFKNGEIFESPKFSNDEINLHKELKQDAIQAAIDEGSLALKAQEGMVKIFMTHIAPLIEIHGAEVRGVTVTVDGKMNTILKD